MPIKQWCKIIKENEIQHVYFKIYKTDYKIPIDHVHHLLTYFILIEQYFGLDFKPLLIKLENWGDSYIK